MSLQPKPSPEEFAAWIGQFREKALLGGISGQVYDQALAGIKFDAEVIEKDRAQPENEQTIWDYLDRAISDQRINGGKAALVANAGLLKKVTDKFGPPPEIIVAIWGLESNYGASRGGFRAIRSLATLAFDARRGEMFQAQLIAALKIIQSGDINADNMLGSWAGAMGHTQFMPTSFLEHAVDFDRDGARNIWGDDPADALASTAAYLQAAGWQNGAATMLEVGLSAGFDFAMAGLGISKTVPEWQQQGVQTPAIAGKTASILVPAGALGPAFLVFANFRAILQYNAAIPYALAVTHLADRIVGGQPFSASWPRPDRAMSRKERREFQERLTALGMNTKGVDGIFGPNTFAALRLYQLKNGLVPDGYPTRDILLRLRA